MRITWKALQEALKARQGGQTVSSRYFASPAAPGGRGWVGGGARGAAKFKNKIEVEATDFLNHAL